MWGLSGKIWRQVLVLSCTFFIGCATTGVKIVSEGGKRKAEGLELSFTKTVKVEEAQDLVDFLVKNKFANGDVKTVALDRTNRGFELSIVVLPGFENDVAYANIVKHFGREISAFVFDGVPVHIHLCDDLLKSLKFIRADHKQVVENKKTYIFFGDEVEVDLAKSLGAYLEKSGFADGDATLISLNKDNQGYNFFFSVRVDARDDHQYLGFVHAFARELSIFVFDGEPVSVHICDDFLQPVKVARAKHQMGKNFHGTWLLGGKGITRDEIVALGRFLVESRFADGNEKLLFLERRDLGYKIEMPVVKGMEQDEHYIEVIRHFARELSSYVFSGEPIHFLLTNGEEQTGTVVQATHDFGLEYQGTYVLVSKPVTEREAAKFGQFLVREKFANGTPRVTVLRKEGDTYEYWLGIQKEKRADPTSLDVIGQFAQEISAEVFNGRPVRIHICDELLKSVSVVPKINSRVIPDMQSTSPDGPHITEPPPPASFADPPP